LGRNFHKLHINKELSYQNSLEYKMKNSKTVFQKLIIVILFINLLFISSIYSQQVSAEFMSSLEPISLSTGEKVEDGVRGVMYHNGKLYVTNVWAGIQCVNVDDIRNPKEIGKYETEHRPHNVYVGETYCYISDELEGITILDLSDPQNPKNVGKIETEGNAFWVEAQYPYVFTAEADHGVHAYDVTDLNNPVRLGSFDTNGWAWYLTVRDNLVYVGDKNGGVQILDFSDKSNPVRYGQYKNLNSARTVFVDDNYAYVANGAHGMTVLDISNPKFPALVSTYPTTGYIFDLYKAGKNVYLADEMNRRVEILNVLNPKEPELQGYYQAEKKVYSVWKKDVYVFVAADDNVLLLRHNNPPTLAEIADQTVDEIATLSITPVASEPDGDPIRFEVKNLPEGATFDSLKGFINWTPTYEQSGSYKDITLTVIEETDTKLSASRTFSIVVNHINRPPVMVQVSDTSISENILLTFEISEGSDPDKEDSKKLEYRAENLPEGAVFDPLTRKFSWTPTYEQSGIYTIDFVIEDPAGALDRDASTITVLHVDRKPEIVAIESIAFNENEKFSVQAKGTDQDKEDQNAISYRAENLPQGAIFDASTQILTWTPTFDQSGVYKDVLLVMTAGRLSDSTMFDLTVNHVNREPELNAIASQNVDEYNLLKFSVSGFDNDVEDKGKLKFSAQNLPEGAVFNADSLIFIWTPSFEQSGEFSDPTFVVTDPAGLSDSKTVKISVNHVNRSPVLNDLQAYTGDENIAINLNITGSDPDVEDKDKQVYSATSLPEGATFVNQNFSWNPSYDQSGQYTVSFTITDGVLSDSKSMDFTINHVNRPPVLNELKAFTGDENVAINLNITGSDPDVEDKDKQVYSAVSLPEGATFVDQIFAWTPTYDQSGKYTVPFTITDGVLSDSKSMDFTINHVNRAPVLDDIAAQSVDENKELSFNITTNDPDVEDAGKLNLTATNLPDGAVFDALSQKFSWIPTYEQSGIYTIDFMIEDPIGALDKVTSTITVNHVDRKPEIVAIKSASINENEEYSTQIKGSDADNEDQNAISFRAENLPQGAIFDANTQILTWTPTFDQSGVYKNVLLVMTAGKLSDSTMFDLTVNHINRAPELNAIVSQNVDENNMLKFSVLGIDNDVEDEGKLKFSAQNLPEGAVFNADSLIFTWIPSFEQSGEYSDPTFVVTDPAGLSDSKTVKISVNHVNRSPVLNDFQPYTGDENVAINLNITGSDPDVEDKDKQVYSAVSLPEGATFTGQDFAWTPTYDQSGTYTVSFTITDGVLSDSKSMDFTINHVNRVPVIDDIAAQSIDENKELTFNITASDPDVEDAGKFQITALDLPVGATFDSPTASFKWLPTFEQSGEYVVTFTNTDPVGLSSSKKANIKVNHVNRTPVFNPLTAQSVAENTLLSYIIPNGSDPDKEDANILEYTALNLPEGALFDQSTMTLTWTPTFEQSGEYTSTITLADGEFTVEQPLPMTVIHVNRPPEMQIVKPQNIDENKQLQFSVISSDPDKEDAGKTILMSSELPQGATFDSQSGSFSWKPTYEQSGEYSVTFKIEDPAGLNIGQTTTINVNHVNRAPVLNPVTVQTTQENIPLNLILVATDEDKEDEGKLKFSSSNLPQGSTLDPVSGAFAWTPTFLQAGSFKIDVKVTDSGELSAIQSVEIQVENVNHNPLLNPIEDGLVDENGVIAFSITGKDEDTDDELVYSISNLPEGAKFNEKSGAFSWTPNYDQAGEYNLTGSVNDGTEQVSATFKITVNNVNRRPEIEMGEKVTITIGETANLSFSGSDPDDDAIAFSSENLPEGATINANGEFTWTPNENQIGTFVFTVNVTDGTDSVQTSASVTVKELPPPPPPDTTNIK
jgi:hypothetical protein